MPTNILKGIVLAFFLTAPAQAQSIPVEEQVQAVVAHLIGVMDTSAQAAVNPERVVVRMTTCKIQVAEDPNSVYLYQEQALAKSLNQPYRQRILNILPSSDDRVESKSYKLVKQENWVGLCDRPENERNLSKSDLDRSVCSVFLKPVVTIYVGETQPGGCPANVRGAVKITNTIILNSAGMETWDRGFDANGKQVWGAQDESYQYRWLQKDNKKK
jgi:hypothetical protein